MSWDRVAYDDGEGYWLECRFPPLGELIIDNLQGPWKLFWFNGNRDTTLSIHASESEARKAGEKFMLDMETAFATKRVQGFQQPDDGE